MLQCFLHRGGEGEDSGHGGSVSRSSGSSSRRSSGKEIRSSSRRWSSDSARRQPDDSKGGPGSSRRRSAAVDLQFKAVLNTANGSSSRRRSSQSSSGFSDDSALTGAQSPGKRPSSGSRRDSNNSIISMIREKCTSSSKHDCPSPSQHSASSPRPAAASQLTAEALRQCALERRHSSDSSDSTVSHSSGHSSAEREAIKDAALQAQRDAASAAAQKAAAQAAAQAAAIAIAKEPLFGHPRYRKLRSVNRGSHGFVQLALDMDTGNQVAIKFIPRGPNMQTKSILRELLNQRLCLQHPHIVQLEQVFLTPNHLGIAMEYANGSDLSDYIADHVNRKGTSIPEAEARRIFQQMVVAISYCHRLGIANRDIKLENALLDGTPERPLLKICDFGYSKNEHLDSKPKSLSGTPDYIAPEVLTSPSYDGKVADIWSCGVMLFIMLTGAFPFWRRGDERANSIVRLQQIFPRILAAEYATPVASPDCLALLRALLTPDPAQRITLPEIMVHPWFVKDLPPGLDAMNDHLVSAAFPPEVQPVQEIMQILQAATRQPDL
mmetsp:Transcript_1527/g.4535  ORF Transcript_1527/g.4535 Transcript_1527/m.4535 type:complete len:550 (-) Transcript_1527:1045-2694(-)